MSAAEMALQGPRRVAELIDEAVSELQTAQRLLVELQHMFLPHGEKTVDAGRVWHRLETIDDRIHNALSKLGD
jgi:hypothetical protein